MGRNEKIKKRIGKIIVEVFELNKLDLKQNLSQLTIENWDSLGHLQLILAVEKEFNIRFSAQKIPSLTSLNSIYEAVIHAERK